MAQKQIAWNSGAGYIKLTYTGHGNGSIIVDSDENNLGTARSQVVTVHTVDGTKSVNLTVRQGANPFPVGKVQDFSYTGDYEEVELPAGKYKLQFWGAQGGSNAADPTHDIIAKAGGKGGYSEGVITLSQKTVVRVYIGGQGSESAGGFNGGGSTTGSSTNSSGSEVGISKMGGGGGASDMRLSDGSLLSRMIVAGGGGGGAMGFKQVTSETNVTDITASPSIVEKSGTLITTGTSQSLWSNADATSRESSGPYGFRAPQSFLIKQITIEAASALSSNSVVIYNAGSDTVLRTSAVNNVAAGVGTYNLNTPLYAATAQIIGWQGASIRYKLSGGDTDTYTRSSKDSAQRIYSFNFKGTQAVKCWVNNYTGFVAGRTYHISGMTASSWRVKFTKTADVYDTSDYVQYDDVTTFTAPSGYNYMHIWTSADITNTITVYHTETVTTTDTYSQEGYFGGGTSGGGYSNTYKGRQNAAGSNGSFGQGANQNATNYRYCSGAGGGGWYGGGMNRSNSGTNYIYYSGGGSGFVNVAASAGNRPSGYVGLELDSGVTYDGSTQFEAPGGGMETGHSGNGYGRITRLE